MAGFFIVLGDIKDDSNRVVKSAKDVFVDLFRTGMYGTNLRLQNNSVDSMWSNVKEATFADYYSMRAGDLLFFFFNRQIYGVARLKNIGVDCKYWGFDGANRPVVYTDNDIAASRLTNTITPQNRCVCFFEPVELFEHAVDMDEALMAYPTSFKSLRVIQDRSFIKLDDEESLALLAVLKRKNESVLPGATPDVRYEAFDSACHDAALQKVRTSDCYYFTARSLLSNYRVWKDTGIQHEMAIEAALVDNLTRQSSPAFEKLDYVSHQVSASPAKPVEYMEWIDVFGYKVSSELSALGVPIQFAIDKYYVIEIKRDDLFLPRPNRGKEVKAVANQLMKYVDWVAKNHANGSYPMVKGIVVAKNFDDGFIEYCKTVCLRNYNNGYRDATPAVWDTFELIKYSFDGKDISFEKVYPGQ